MKVNIYFIGLFIGTLILIAIGYFILNPRELGYCLDVASELQCIGQDVYIGIGKTFYYSLNAFALIFFILIFTPSQILQYWYRIVLPLGILGVLFILVSSPVPVNMFDPPRSDVARSIGIYLLLLSLLVIGFSIFRDIFSSKKSRG
jgi:hypothetical protein